MAKNVKSVTCASCGSRFKSVAGLRAHERVFHQGRERPLSIEAAAKEMDGYFKLWDTNANGKLGEKLGEPPVPAPVPVPLAVTPTRPVDGNAARLDDAFTFKVRNEYHNVEIPVTDIPVELHAEPEPTRPKFHDEQLERLKSMVPMPSYGYRASQKRKQRQMIGAFIAAMILIVPCAYYWTGLFTGITPINMHETPTSFEDVRDIEVIDAFTEDDITAFVSNFTLCTATEPSDWLTYHVVIQSPNVTAVLVELREYAYTPASFHVFLHIEFDSTYANKWVELVPTTYIHITCLEA